MVYWDAEEIQQRGFPPGVRHSDRWRNLDIPVWLRNKAPVIGLSLSRWRTPNQSQEAKECWEENGGLFLLNEWSSGNCCARGSEDSYSGMVHRSLSPPRILKNQEKRPRTGLGGILLHHDNASSYIANATIVFLEKTPVKLMTHPAYSPDLAPCDFSLFPNVMNRMCGHRFPSPEDAVAAYNEELSAMSENQWHGCFQKRFQRMQRCIERPGEYFEKM